MKKGRRGRSRSSQVVDEEDVAAAEVRVDKLLSKLSSKQVDRLATVVGALRHAAGTVCDACHFFKARDVRDVRVLQILVNSGFLRVGILTSIGDAKKRSAPETVICRRAGEQQGANALWFILEERLGVEFDRNKGSPSRGSRGRASPGSR